jgi:outer membrane protein OmpA-like peptidoglycan-associated protein
MYLFHSSYRCFHPMNKTITLALILFISACASDPNQRAKQGAIIGAVAGAVIGDEFNDKNGKYIGAVLGGLAGAGVGQYMDKQRAELEDALEREKQQGLEIEHLENNSIKLNIPSEISFDVDSALVTAGFRPTLDQISTILVRYPETSVNIIGHTDSTGSEEYNQSLSERRAESVANYFVSQQVSRPRLSTAGVGESRPRADNSTESGRQQNRRVEIIIIPNQV